MNYCARCGLYAGKRFTETDMANQEKAKEESRIKSFFKGVKTEFRKIIWPDKFTLGKQLAAVVSITVVAGVIIALVDYVSRIVINLVVGL